MCNRLHSYNLKGYDFWIWISKVPLRVIDYNIWFSITCSKFKFKILFNSSFSFFPFGNRLHFLEIDYQSLAWLWNPLFWGKAWSLVNLETRLCLLKHSWINLEANAYLLKRPCLILLWHLQNSCIHTFTFWLHKFNFKFKWNLNWNSNFPPILCDT